MVTTHDEDVVRRSTYHIRVVSERYSGLEDRRTPLEVTQQVEDSRLRPFFVVCAAVKLGPFLAVF